MKVSKNLKRNIASILIVSLIVFILDILNKGISWQQGLPLIKSGYVFFILQLFSFILLLMWFIKSEKIRSSLRLFLVLCSLVIICTHSLSISSNYYTGNPLSLNWHKIGAYPYLLAGLLVIIALLMKNWYPLTLISFAGIIIVSSLVPLLLSIEVLTLTNFSKLDSNSMFAIYFLSIFLVYFLYGILN